MGKERKTPTFNLIHNVLTEFQREAGAKKKRGLGKELHEKLSQSEIRRKLGLEATPASAEPDDPSIVATRCHKLSHFYHLVIQSAITLGESILTGKKAKITPSDVLLPYEILKEIKKPDDGFDNEGRGITKISRKTIRLLLKHCLAMLDQDDVLPIAEKELLEQLAYLCSRVEHVGYFKAADFAVIMEVLGSRLSPDLGDSKYDIFYPSARAFCGLFQSCRTLGIDVRQYLSSGVEMVSSWCKHQIIEENIKPSSEILPYFINGLVALLNLHPELSIEPMRRYGRHILRFTKKCYARANGVQKHALNEYLLAHLLVAQVAGDVQGLPDGYLGDLGKASLSESQTSHFLTLVLGDVARTVQLGDLKGSTSSSAHSGSRQSGPILDPLNTLQRAHLELVARLMAHAQRQYIGKEEWGLIEDHEQYFNQQVGELGNDGEWETSNAAPQQPCTVEQVAASPWSRHILCSLFHWTASETSLDGSILDTSQQEDRTVTDYPLLRYFSTAMEEDTSKTPLLSILPVIAACAEVFPSGMCWVSSCQSHWTKLDPIDKMREATIFSHGCSLLDFAIIVHLLARLLVVIGSSGQHLSVQHWLLVTLTRLTETSAIISQNIPYHRDGVAAVAEGWRSVCAALFRHDLRYLSYTEKAASGSLGDLVLVLLTHITRHRCTEPPTIVSSKGSTSNARSFMYEIQPKIWALPVFARPELVKCGTVFELVSSVLHCSGLSESGSDQLNSSLGRAFFSDSGESILASRDSSRQSIGRRGRLVCFLVAVLENALRGRKNGDTFNLESETFVAALSGCLISLVDGSGDILAALPGSSSLSFQTSGNTSMFQVTLAPADELDITETSYPPYLRYFQKLWSCDYGTQGQLSSDGSSDAIRRYHDKIHEVSRRLHKRLAEMESVPSTGRDFVSQVESVEMRLSLSKYFARKLSFAFKGDASTSSEHFDQLDGYSSSDSAGDANSIAGSWKSLAAKLLMTTGISSRLDISVQFTKECSPDMKQFLCQVPTILPGLCADRSDFLVFSTHVEQILRMMVEMSSESLHLGIDESTFDALSTCSKQLIRAYAARARFAEARALQSKAVQKSGSRRDVDDDLFDEDDDDVMDSSRVLTKDKDPPRGTVDDDSDESVGGKRKRLSFSTNSRKGARKRRMLESVQGQLSPPDLSCAERLCSILVLLDPSAYNCKLVTESLLGIELDLDPDSIEGDMDLRAVPTCVRLLCDLGFIFHGPALSKYHGEENVGNGAAEDATPVITLCRIIELVRVCATPEWPLYGFGYLACSDMVRMAEDPIREKSMTKLEVDSTAAILTDADRIHSIVPIFRSYRIQGASSTFKAAGRLFHEMFDKDFVGNFLKTSIVDSSSIVRKESRVCMALAMSALNEEKTMDFVLKYSPPITYSTTETDVLESFCSWFDNMRLSPTPDSSDNNFYGIDAFPTMEHDSIMNRVTLACAARSEGMFRKLLCEIICIAAERPDLEGCCFRGLEEIAFQRSYQSLEAMIEEESCAIINRWVKDERDLQKFPLTIAAPSTLRQIQRGGRSQVLLQNGNRDSDGFSPSKISSHASWAFLTRYSRFSIPLALVRSIAKLDSAQLNLQNLFGQVYMKRLVGILMHKEDPATGVETKDIAVVLKQHAADVLGFCVVMEHSDDVNQVNLGKNVRKLLESAVTQQKLQRRVHSKKNVIIRRILELSGMPGQCLGLLPTNQEAFFNGINGFVISIDPLAKGKGDILLSVGSSLTEFLIEALLWLDGSPRESLKIQRWSAVKILIQLMLNQIQSGEYKLNQFGRVIHTVTEVILRGEKGSVRVQAVQMLLDILKAVRDHVQNGAENQRLHDEVLNTIPRIVGVCYCVHESAQKSLLAHCHSQYSRSFSVISCGLGMLGIAKVQAGDVWGWDTGMDGLSAGTSKIKAAVAEFGPRASNDLLDIVYSTFDVLEWISDNEKILGVDSLSFSGTASPVDRNRSKSSITSTEFEALQDLNTRLCGQGLTDRFVSELSPTIGSFGRLNEIIAGFHARLASGRSWASNQDRIDTTLSLTMEQRLIYSDLRQIERSLKFLRRSKNQQLLNVSSPEDANGLVKDLALVCGTKWPLQLRDTASRCLGEIDMETIKFLCQQDNLQPQAIASKSQESIRPKSVLPKLQADCICILAGLLGSPSPDIALLAAKTLGGVLATESAKVCLEQIDDPKIRIDIEPFIQQEPSDRLGNLMLTKSQISKLFRESVGPEPEDNSWCWDEHLWRFDSKRSTFEDWICILTPAIIVCSCRHDEKESDPNSKHIDAEYTRFLSLCGKMSMKDPNFAASVFKFVVVSLLVSHDSTSNGRRSSGSRAFVVKDPGIRDHLSRCFTVLLTAQTFQPAADDSSSSAALKLAIQIASLLRRITQQVFLDSGGHRTNLTKTLPKARDDGNSDGLEPPVMWQGVPFGVIMNIDGLLLAKACVQTRQFADALFFIELHLNAQLGASGGILELVSKDQLNSMSTNCHQTALDLSGTNSVRHGENILTTEDIKRRALEVIRLMKRCFEETHNVEDLAALQIEEASLDFVDRGHLDTEDLNTNSLSYFQRLDNAFYFGHNKGQVHGKIINFLGAAGMNHTLKAYIDGAVSNRSMDSVSTESDAKAWREKWFESSFYEKNWELCGIENDQATGRSNNNMGSLASDLRHEKNLSISNSGGFFESLCAALESWSLDDMASCHSFLEQGRIELLQSVALAGGGESELYQMVPVIDHLQGLGDLESLLSRNENLGEIADMWGLSHNDSEESEIGNYHHLNDMVVPSGVGYNSALSFGSRIREIILRMALQKENTSNGSSIKDFLSTHLWRVCSAANQFDLPHESEAILRRLTSLLQSNSTPRGEQTNQYESIIQIRLEEAKIMESRKDFSAAIRRSKQVVDNLLARQTDHSGNLESKLEVLLADALVTCGSWMGDYKFEQAKIILNDYLQPGALYARKIFEKNASTENASRSTSANLALAQLAAGLYDGLNARLTSPEWTKMINRMKQNQEEIGPMELEVEELKKAASKKGGRKSDKAKDVARYREKAILLNNLVKQTEAMVAERIELENSVGIYLNLAVKSFGHALATAGSEHSSDLTRHVCRLISLWFNGNNNFSGDKDEDSTGEENVDNLMMEISKSVPSFRFVSFAPQLVSRIEIPTSKEDKRFQGALHQLISKMSLEHPYHCIPHLISLSNGKNIGSGLNGRNSQSYLENVDDSKIDAVNNIIGHLEKESPKFVGQLLKGYRILTDAYICLADVPTKVITDLKKEDVKHQEVVKNSSKRLVTCLEKFESCMPCILTSPPPLRSGCDYGDGVDDPVGGERVHGFEETFRQTDTGIHRPKIVVCYGSRGGRFRQLVKGEDEIRQDAVMSQVFSFVNDLMVRPVSKGRLNSRPSHKITTYNIVPLSPTHGVLEWVENTLPFGNYINDTKKSKASGKARIDIGAHSKYYPGEWSNPACRNYLDNSNPDHRRSSFDQICRRHSPCFRFFFMERFGHSMQEWYAARTRYTRSVAVNSMVGHILGIGDRHCFNILVHQATGDIVHIDFGVVFEQGKLLTTPERVPFRLTRNIIDGMGPCGTEGTFTSAAEETMRALRENSSELLTILSAIVSDPLYKWSVNETQARKRQMENDDDEAGFDEEEQPINRQSPQATSIYYQPEEDHNKAAMMAMAKIDEKLKGFEDGTSGEQQSVESQVQLLITTARDPDNLAVMFGGWSPWV